MSFIIFPILLINLILLTVSMERLEEIQYQAGKAPVVINYMKSLGGNLTLIEMGQETRQFL